MLSSKVTKALINIVGRDFFSDEKEDLLSYAYDATQEKKMPEAVVFPGSAEEISAIIKLANKYHFPVIPRGAGTGMAGGAVPLKGGVVIVLSRLNRILKIDEKNFYVWVEPGVITGELQQAVAEKGLFYPPDPASLSFSTIGGNIATCAGGARAVKYGVTRDYVLALEIVLPTGEIIHTGRKTIKGVSGYDITSFFVGSEGTLGIFTKILLRLLPFPPAKGTILLNLEKLKVLPHLLMRLLHLPERLTAIEFMDDLCRECIKDKFPFDLPPGEGLLLLEVDGSEKVVNIMLENIITIANELKVEVIKKEKKEKSELWEIRRAISPILFQLGEKKASYDIVVPYSHIFSMIKKIKMLRKEYKIHILCFGHIGDGNLHVNILYSSKEKNKAETIAKEIIKNTLNFGGTITGEHGIGYKKAAFLPWEIEPNTLHLMKRLKHTLDPNNILNPGKIFTI
ncbi:MAG: FAD-binding oxidoreductase [Candidatus Desulfofervidus auxilii]|nr:FAD-binding oxidoreductase [Candidatus Desulfofervidus auxilii]